MIKWRIFQQVLTNQYCTVSRFETCYCWKQHDDVFCLPIHNKKTRRHHVFWQKARGKTPGESMRLGLQDDLWLVSCVLVGDKIIMIKQTDTNNTWPNDPNKNDTYYHEMHRQVSYSIITTFNILIQTSMSTFWDT